MQPRVSYKPNDVLSKVMQVKKLAPGEVRIYRLIAADQNSLTTTTEEGGKVPNKPARNLSKMSLVRDIETGERVMIGNVTSVKFQKQPDGSELGVQVCSPPKFHNGSLRVTEDDFATVQYMERHDGNTNNPFRDKTKPPVFYTVNRQKKSIDTNNRLLMLGEALTWIGNADHVELKAINEALPAGLKVDMNQEYPDIRAELMTLTEKDPISVMKASNNKLAITKITIMECENYGILMWDEKDRKWFYNDKEQEDVAVIEIGTNRIEGLISFFHENQEGRKTYGRMVKKLVKFLNHGAPK